MSTHQEIFCRKSFSDIVKKIIINEKKEVVIFPLFANASVAEKIVIVQVSVDNLYRSSQIAVVYGLKRWK